MIWAILSLVIVFALGIILKAPQVSEEEIRMNQLREQANREYLEQSLTYLILLGIEHKLHLAQMMAEKTLSFGKTMK